MKWEGCPLARWLPGPKGGQQDGEMLREDIGLDPGPPPAPCGLGAWSPNDQTLLLPCGLAGASLPAFPPCTAWHQLVTWRGHVSSPASTAPVDGRWHTPSGCCGWDVSTCRAWSRHAASAH